MSGMLYEFTGKDGKTKMVEANHKAHAAQFVADTEFTLQKLDAGRALKLQAEGVELLKAPQPKARAK